MPTPVAAPEHTDTRTRILDVADRLFLHYGYSKTTVADLARELGMSPANVYRFFSSKLEIVQAIAEQLLAERHAHNLSIAAGPGTASQRLVRFFIDNHRMSIEAFITEPKAYEIVEVAMARQWPTIASYLSRMTDVLEMLIIEGVKNGEFSAETDTRRSAACARQACISLFHPTLLLQCTEDVERADAEELAEFILRALRCGRPPLEPLRSADPGSSPS